MAFGAHTETIGTRVFGGYTITEPLGEGAMGAVFVAEHAKLGKKIAVKILHPHMAMNPVIAGRFLAEARAMAALDHPNVIKVHDAATLADGREYIAMEYLAGQPLDVYIKSRDQLELTTTLIILAQVCCGLEAAHYRGIIHRDLKPGNIFVYPTKLNPLSVKILDFGIAKLADPELSGGVETNTNAIAGTPGYMAPEQTRGMRDVDHRTDIYALGVIAYRMLSKKMPFDGETVGEIFYQQVTAEPTPIQEHRPDVPKKWWEIILRALANEPANRQPDASSFARELAAAIPYGFKTVQEVAPLLVTEEWLASTRKMQDRQVLPIAAAPAPGATVTYREEPGPQDSGTIYQRGAPPPQTGPIYKPGDEANPAPAPETLQGIARPVASSLRRPLIAGLATALLVVTGLLVFAWVRGPSSSNSGAAAAPDGSAPAEAPDAGQAIDAGRRAAVDAAAHSALPDAAPDKEERDSRPGKLMITVSPWAAISIDGKGVGNAPLSLTLPPGRYTVTIDGPKTETTRVRIKPGKTTALRREW